MSEVPLSHPSRLLGSYAGFGPEALPLPRGGLVRFVLFFWSYRGQSMCTCIFAFCFGLQLPGHYYLPFASPRPGCLRALMSCRRCFDCRPVLCCRSGQGCRRCSIIIAIEPVHGGSSGLIFTTDLPMSSCLRLASCCSSCCASLALAVARVLAVRLLAQLLRSRGPFGLK